MKISYFSRDRCFAALHEPLWVCWFNPPDPSSRKAAKSQRFGNRTQSDRRPCFACSASLREANSGILPIHFSHRARQDAKVTVGQSSSRIFIFASRSQCVHVVRQGVNSGHHEKHEIRSSAAPFVCFVVNPPVPPVLCLRGSIVVPLWRCGQTPKLGFRFPIPIPFTADHADFRD
jgi:hypothetical protein